MSPLPRVAQDKAARADLCMCVATVREVGQRAGVGLFFGDESVGSRVEGVLVVSGGQTERAGARAKGGKVAMFSGSCEQKSPAIVHSLLYLPRPSFPPVSLSLGDWMKMSCVSPQPSLPLPSLPLSPRLHSPSPLPPTHVQLSYKEVSTQ